MFGIKKKGAEIKQPVYVVLVPEVAAYASAASFPVDAVGKLVFLNDTVEHEYLIGAGKGSAAEHRPCEARAMGSLQALARRAQACAIWR